LGPGNASLVKYFRAALATIYKMQMGVVSAPAAPVSSNETSAKSRHKFGILRVRLPVPWAHVTQVGGPRPLIVDFSKWKSNSTSFSEYFPIEVN